MSMSTSLRFSIQELLSNFPYHVETRKVLLLRIGIGHESGPRYWLEDVFVIVGCAIDTTVAGCYCV